MYKVPECVSECPVAGVDLGFKSAVPPYDQCYDASAQPFVSYRGFLLQGNTGYMCKIAVYGNTACSGDEIGSINPVPFPASNCFNVQNLLVSGKSARFSCDLSATKRVVRIKREISSGSLMPRNTSPVRFNFAAYYKPCCVATAEVLGQDVYVVSVYNEGECEKPDLLLGFSSFNSFLPGNPQDGYNCETGVYSNAQCSCTPVVTCSPTIYGVGPCITILQPGTNIALSVRSVKLVCTSNSK
jgi:hypothetical protein